MRQTLVKVYASVSPAHANLERAVATACASAMGNDDWLFLEGDMLRISFEGMYFPLDEALAVLAQNMESACSGKLDYLDMEAWTLTRCLFEGNSVTRSTRSLNHVLDYSGH